MPPLLLRRLTLFAISETKDFLVRSIGAAAMCRERGLRP
jgi:hypothetical protein